MLRSRTAAFVTVLVPLAMIRCDAPAPPAPPPSPEALAAVPDLVEGSNRFACDLFRKQEQGNVCLGNSSIWTAMAMTWLGARDTTATQIAAAMHYDPDLPAFHPGMAALTRTLTTGLPRGVQLDIANRLWGAEGAPFVPAYLAAVERDYRGGFETLDFKGDPKGSVRRINGWVADNTSDRIKDLLSPDDIKALTRLVLTNAMYFKARWADEFDPDATAAGPFQVSETETVQAMMMTRRGTYRYAAHDDAMLLELPYAGNTMSMVLVLPAARHRLADLEKTLSPERLGDWLGKLRQLTLMVTLPKFTMRTKLRLGQVLSDMGMPIAFSDAANFTGMSTSEPLKLDFVVHEAFVQVNEEGTEAAAATGIGVVATSLPPTFRADQPFLFIIRDVETGLILFLGRVQDPTQES